MHIGVISPEQDAVVDEPKQSPRYLRDDVDGRAGKRADADHPQTPRGRSRAAIIGVMLTALVAVGAWLAASAVWSAVAGESGTDVSPMWPGVVYGAGSLTSVLALPRRGILTIPGNLRRVELPVNLRATAVIFLLILQFIGEVLLPRVLGS